MVPDKQGHRYFVHNTKVTRKSRNLMQKSSLNFLMIGTGLSGCDLGGLLAEQVQSAHLTGRRNVSVGQWPK